MPDSPVIHAQLDPQEQPILDKLLDLRKELLDLKQNRTTYIKAQDVLPLYERVIEQVHLLNDVRSEKRDEQNRGPQPRIEPLWRNS